MVKPLAGGAVQTSAGFGITVDQQSVRHPKSPREQAEHIRGGSYTPREKLKAESVAQWQTRLVSNTRLVEHTVARLDKALAAFDADQAPTKRAWSHQLGRAVNWVAAVPDGGNLKVNRQKALQLADPVPRGRHRSVDPDDGAPEAGYASLEPHTAALSLIEKHYYIGRLKQEAVEMDTALLAVQRQAAATRLSQPSLYLTAVQEIGRQGVESEAVLAGAEARVQQVRQSGGAPRILANAQQWRDAVAAAHANLMLPALLAKLKPALARLSEADRRAGEGAAGARTALRHSQGAEIERAIAALPGFAIGAGQQAAADLVRERLRQAAATLLARPFDPAAHVMPAPLLVDILLDVLAQSTRGDIAQVARGAGTAAADSLTGWLEQGLERRVLLAVRGLPGGSLAAEQLCAQQVENPDRRVAMRVAALATQALAELPAPSARGRRATLLRVAAEAADAIVAGRRDACDPPRLAAHNAVRNGFLLKPQEGDRADPYLDLVDERLNKFRGAWVERADDPDWHGGPLLNKTPFDPKSLRLANQTAVRGYGAPERTMARLDTTLLRVAAQLDVCVAQVAPASLDADEAVRLAAILLAARKARAGTGTDTEAGVESSPRPGQIALDRADAAALGAIVRDRLLPLTAASPAALKAAIARLLDGANTRVGDALQIAPFVAALAERIGAPDAAARKAKAGLLKDAALAGDMASAARIDHIGSLEDLYRFLAPLVQQIESRGKIKISSGGNLGASTKLLTWPVSVATQFSFGIVAPVRAEIKGNRARAAVFEISVSVVGIEIFIGSEIRKGGGLGAGAGVRVGWEAVISAGGGIDKTVSRTDADTEGVWLRLPRNGDEERTRDETLAMLATLLDMDPADGPAPAGPPGDDGAAMPPLVGRLLARHPNLSISVVDRYREKNLRNEVAVNAGLLNVKVVGPDNTDRFGFLTAQLKSERRDKRVEQRDLTGFLDITRSHAFSGGAANAELALVSVGAGFGMDEHASGLPGFGNGLAYGRQLAQKGIDSKLRWVIRDGETSALETWIEYDNLDFDNHVARIERDRRAWLETGVKALFKADPAQARALPPLNEQMRVAEHWLDSTLEQARGEVDGNARPVYSYNYALRQSVAATVDGMRAKAALARRAGAEERAARIDARIDQLLQHRASWQPWRIPAGERTSEKEQRGANLGLVLGSSTSVEAQRNINSYPV